MAWPVPCSSCGVIGAARNLLAVLSTLGCLSACSENSSLTYDSARARQSIPAQTLALMASKGTHENSPILIRTFKKEAEFEIWKMKDDGEYTLLKTYPMCRWSGQLGPKVREGDRQVPEGFYTITPAQMNPHSNYYLSFNVGYPNAIDRALGHTGGAIMVHGDCSSAGCFSMTDRQIAEIYAIAREAFAGGQREIQMQSYPFRMSAENLAKHRYDKNIAFWRFLKEGSDHFEVTKHEPVVAACGRHYVFDAKMTNPSDVLDASSPCPQLTMDESLRVALLAKEQKDNKEVADLVAKGIKPIKLVYDDGGQNPEFAYVDIVSRPDALSHEPQEIVINEQGEIDKAYYAALKTTQYAAAASAKPSTPLDRSLTNGFVGSSRDVRIAQIDNNKIADKGGDHGSVLMPPVLPPEPSHDVNLRNFMPFSQFNGFDFSFLGPDKSRSANGDVYSNTVANVTTPSAPSDAVTLPGAPRQEREGIAPLPPRRL